MFIDSLGSNVVKDAGAITCNTSLEPDKDNSCHTNLRNNLIAVQDAVQDQYLVPVIVGTLICFAFMVIICTSICIKDRCRIWLFSRYGIRIEVKGTKTKAKNTDDEGEAPVILFDALLLYSSKDHEPYVQDICQSLEPTYRLCLLHRDLSGIYTSEAFKSAVQASRKYIVLLSPHFLATEWQHFQETWLSPQKLIIIKVDDQGLQLDLDQFQDVQKFLKTVKKMIKWHPEKQLWKNLK